MIPHDGCGREKTCVELAPPIFCFLPENYGWNSHFSWTWKTVIWCFESPRWWIDFGTRLDIEEDKWKKFTLILHGPKSNFPPYVRPQRRRTKPASCVQQKPQLEQVDCETRTTPSANSGLRKKGKSPSTRRRDKQRREKWIAQKRSHSNKDSKSSSVPISCPVGLSAIGVESPSLVSTVVKDTATEISTVSPTSPRRTVLSFPGSSETLDTPTASRAEEQLLLSPSDSPLKTPKQESPSRRNSESLDSEDLSECWFPACSAFGLPRKLKKCTRCSVALYCNKDCQAQHWPIHRLFCGRVKKPGRKRSTDCRT